MIKRERVFRYLDDLRESGIVNMYRSSAYVQRQFKLPSKEADALVGEWMAAKQAETAKEEKR